MRIFAISLLSITLLHAQTAPPDKVVLTIGDEKITAAELDRTIDALPEQVRAAARGPNRRQFAETIIRIKLLAREAQKRKLDETPAYQTQLAFQKDNLLAGLLYQDLAANLKVDEAAARQFYEQHKSEYESATARHILVRTKGSPVPLREGQPEMTDEGALAKAQELRKRISAGEDFSTVAKESDDVGSAAQGGSLGSFKRGQMTPAFEQAAFAMSPGQLSEPVKTQFGYHLIKLDGKEAKTFDELRPELEKRIRPELAQKRIEEFRKETLVMLDEQYFGPPK